jgi:hypothetical protein
MLIPNLQLATHSENLSKRLLDQRRALMPLVDIFFDAFRPFLTEAYDDDVTFSQCFDINGLTQEQQQLLQQQQELVPMYLRLLLKLQQLRVPEMERQFHHGQLVGQLVCN